MTTGRIGAAACLLKAPQAGDRKYVWDRLGVQLTLVRSLTGSILVCCLGLGCG